MAGAGNKGSSVPIRDRQTFDAWVAREAADDTPKRVKVFEVINRLHPRYREWIEAMDDLTKDRVYGAFLDCSDHPSIKGAQKTPRLYEAQWGITYRYCQENEIA